MSARPIARILTASAAVALMAGAAQAQAQTTAFATTDLNLRAGPGPQYEIIDVIADNGEASVEGCIENSNWCKVNYAGTQGWAYGEYLSFPVVIQTQRKVYDVETVTYNENEKEKSAIIGGALGTVAGALVGGPAAIAAGAALGGITAADRAPEEQTVTYLREHPVDPVFLDGEVVVGAGIPEGVEIYEVPDSQLTYLNVNGRMVLVEPSDRRVVYIVR